MSLDLLKLILTGIIFKTNRQNSTLSLSLVIYLVHLSICFWVHDTEILVYLWYWIIFIWLKSSLVRTLVGYEFKWEFTVFFLKYDETFIYRAISLVFVSNDGLVNSTGWVRAHKKASKALCLVFLCECPFYFSF